MSNDTTASLTPEQSSIVQSFSSLLATFSTTDQVTTSSVSLSATTTRTTDSPEPSGSATSLSFTSVTSRSQSIPSTTTAGSAPATTLALTHGLSAGAAGGVGAVCGVVFVLLVILGCFVVRRGKGTSTRSWSANWNRAKPKTPSKQSFLNVEVSASEHRRNVGAELVSPSAMHEIGTSHTSHNTIPERPEVHHGNDTVLYGFGRVEDGR